MKTTLLCLFGAVGFVQAQTINEYYGHLAASVTNGVNHREYVVVQSTPPIDQTPSGANATWNFSQLTPLGPTVYDNAAPSGGEAGTYPGTTMVTTNVNSVGIVQTVSKLFTVMNQALTGVTSEASQLNINYTNNATIGTFPLAFGYSHTDPIAGTYTYTTYSGTFTGTIVSTVDAYGTLTTNDYGYGPNEIDVVRLKTVQNMNLNYPPLTNVGTATITNYHYYRTGELYPFFTSATTSINVPLLAIDQTISGLEAAAGAILATPNFTVQNISLAPNPVKDILNIQTNNQPIRSIAISDGNGRTIISASTLQSIDLSHLASGVYFARIETDGGNQTKKIVKE